MIETLGRPLHLRLCTSHPVGYCRHYDHQQAVAGAPTSATARQIGETEAPTDPNDEGSRIGTQSEHQLRPEHARRNSKTQGADWTKSQISEYDKDDIEKRESYIDKRESYIDSEQADQEHRDAEVLKLARSLTQQSSYSLSEGQNPFQFEADSSLDPHSPHFKARSWAKAMIGLKSRDPDKYPARTSGIAFRDLNVWGFGAATDYQKDVANIWFEAVGIVRKILKIGQRKIDILQHFDGLVESGEMLVVLGPPGSGCSTLLKTITGETHGINVDPNSHINYQGEPKMPKSMNSTG